MSSPQQAQDLLTTYPVWSTSAGCENCREQHLRCDRVLPICGRCQAAGRDCRRTALKIRPTHTRYAKKQKWIEIPKNLVFVDETDEIIRDAPNQESGDHDQFVTVGLFSPKPSTDSLSPDKSRTSVQAESATASYGAEAPGSPTDRFIRLDRERSLSREPADKPGSEHSQETDPSSLESQVYLAEPIWPLSNPVEAMLFRHFVQKLAIWLDLCDPRRSFETLVPQRAGTCQILLNAIFALSARHLGNISDFDPLMSNRYHEECLRYLIPMLGFTATGTDENLFAATIILRVLEEMEVKNMGMDNHGYLLGIHAFVKAGDRSLLPGSLSAAAFWVGLRQEIYSAVMNHQPVRINLVHALVDRSLDDEADEHMWANRAIVHCADVLNFCFGSFAGQYGERWEELDDWNRRWTEMLPPSFVPVYCRESEGDAFPEIWYHASCHVIGIQHHLLAGLFLTQFDPKVPRVGGHRRTAERQMSERIQQMVKRVCGIGLGNQWTPPGMFTACMAIAAFGDRFSERRDQEAMLDILRTTEEHHARPTEAVQHQMMKAWGWISEG